MLSSHYHELIEKIEQHEKKIYLMIDVYMLDKVSNKIKEIINVDNFDSTKTMINTNDKLTDYITLKNVVILITCYKR